METDLIQVVKELSPIMVAVISSVAALISGVVASLVSPWVHYYFEDCCFRKQHSTLWHLEFEETIHVIAKWLVKWFKTYKFSPVGCK